MNALGSKFKTVVRIERSFSILDLEFAGTSKELTLILKGIKRLSDPLDTKRCMQALKWQLYIDFLFMLTLYPLIAMMCIKVAMKMSNWGDNLYFYLAAAQLLPFIFDIAENVYLLKKINTPILSKTRVYNIYKNVVLAKWLVALAGFICSAFGLLYFWVAGRFQPSTIRVPVILVLIVIAWYLFHCCMFKKSKG